MPTSFMTSIGNAPIRPDSKLELYASILPGANRRTNSSAMRLRAP
jgi:hypothetical protein